MGNVRKKFLDPLLVVFSGPDADDLKSWIEVYEENLKGFTDSQLQNAVKHLIRTRTIRSFPLPAECKIACNSVSGIIPKPPGMSEKIWKRIQEDEAKAKANGAIPLW